jgi:hypothetical protein
MKKVQGFGIIFLLVFSLILSMNLVSAKSFATPVNKFIEDATDTLKPIFTQLLGKDKKSSDDVNSQYLFARVLLFFVILGIIWTALNGISYFEERKAIVFLISAAMSIISMRAIVTPDMIETIMLPTNALGVSLSVAIPFVVCAFLIESKQGLGDWPRAARNTAWILFIIVMMGLWFVRYDSLTEAGKDPFTMYIYPVAAGVAFLFILFDGSFQHWRATIYAKKAGDGAIKEEIKELTRQLKQAHADIAAGIGAGHVYASKAQYTADVTSMQTRISVLKKQLSS